MKKVVLRGVREAALLDVPDPRPWEDWVVVKVHVAPMCTEYKGFVRGEKADFLGHEAAGEVVEVAQPGPVKVGDRVVVQPLNGCGVCSLCLSGDYIHCLEAFEFPAQAAGGEGRATMAQYLLKRSRLLSPIPEDVSYERASLACCALGPSFGAFERLRVDAFDTVLITGAGPVGLGAIVNARYRGARAIVVESHPYRVELAKKLGADRVIDPAEEDAADQVLAATDGLGADKALDCSGAVAAHRLCLEATRRRGQVAFVGECFEETPLRVSNDLLRKGLTLHGSWHYNLADYHKLLQVIRRSPLLDTLVTHVLPMSRIQEAMEISASRDCGKILLKPWE